MTIKGQKKFRKRATIDKDIFEHESLDSKDKRLSLNLKTATNEHGILASIYTTQNKDRMI